MIRSILCVFALLAASACGGATEPSPAERQGFDPARLDAMQMAFEQQVKDGRLPGAVMLVSRRGQIIHEVAVGFADIDAGTPLRTDSLFRIYSMTKPVVTVAALQQIEDGLYTLDTPVTEFLPEFEALQVVGEDGELRPVSATMTIRQLMTHTAGFSYNSYGLVEEAESLDAFIAAIAAEPLPHEPGAAFEYGLETDVLGAIVERAAGEPLADILEARIFEPLGMDDTAFCVGERDLARLPDLYAYGEKRVLSVRETADDSRWACPVKMAEGGGGLVSTARDYWRFAEALRLGGVRDGVRILSEESAALLAQPQAGVDEAATTSWWMGGTDWGLNMAVVTDASANQWLDVDGNYYWSGAASTYFWIDPANEMTAIFMTQVLRGNHPNTFKDDHRNLVYEAFVEPARPAE